MKRNSNIGSNYCSIRKIFSFIKLTIPATLICLTSFAGTAYSQLSKRGEEIKEFRIAEQSELNQFNTGTLISGETPVLKKETPLKIQQPTTRTITGVVFDESGSPLPGATLFVQGTTIGTATDGNGEFTLDIPVDAKILTCSFIGYESQDVEIQGKSIFQITLQMRGLNIDEIVVVGYGVQTKESSVGAISQVEGKELIKSGATTLSNAFTGQLSGVVTVQNSGQPGDDAAKIYIRGISTWDDNTPLVLVDGVERNYNQIDPNEIESISVLKDASATAVFGVKGANGVILITTKRGKVGKLELTYNSEYTAKQPIFRGQIQDSYTTGLIMNEAYANDNTWGSQLSDEVLQHYKDQDMPYIYPNVNWKDELVKDYGFATKHNIGLSGGTEFAKVFASLSYLHDGDILNTQKNDVYDPSYKYERYNYRTNVDVNVTKSTVLSLESGGYIGIRNQSFQSGNQRIYRPIFTLTPMSIPMYYPAEFLETHPDAQRPDESGDRIANTLLTNANNPYLNLNNSGFKQYKNTSFDATIVLKQDLSFITKGLTVQGKVAYTNDVGYQKEFEYNAASYKYLEDGTWSRTLGTGNDTGLDGQTSDVFPIEVKAEDINDNPYNSWYFEARANYARSFGKHNVTGLFVGQRRKYQNNVSFPHFEEGLVGRVTYNYNAKYLLELNAGVNGSEQFSPENRYGFFPSGAIGWNIHNEKFIADNLAFLKKAKIRYSYGEVGSGNLGGQRWLYTSTYENAGENPDIYRPGQQLNHNNGSGVSITPIREGQVANENATWERAIKHNLGFEFAFFDRSKLSINVDLFKEERDNILLNRLSVPSWFGVATKDQNLGKTETQGYEVEVLFRNYIGDFFYNLKVGVAFADNRIIERDEPLYRPDYRKQQGKRIGQLFGYVSDGYVDNVDERAATLRYGNGIYGLGDVVYVDFTGDGNIDEMDQVPIGYAGTYPLYNIPISGGFNYKSFDFSFTIQGALKMTRYLNDAFLWPLHRISNHYYDYQSDFWTPDNTDNPQYPALHFDVNRTHNNISDGTITTTNVRDASYLKLRNLQMGYSIAPQKLTKYQIQSFRIYLQGNNLITYAPDYPVGDPESADGGGGVSVTNGSYPLIRRITLGLQVSF
jgi:TonB-linked SusC/RagA family outer membrane protein